MISLPLLAIEGEGFATFFKLVIFALVFALPALKKVFAALGLARGEDTPAAPRPSGGRARRPQPEVEPMPEAQDVLEIFRARKAEAMRESELQAPAEATAAPEAIKPVVAAAPKRQPSSVRTVEWAGLPSKEPISTEPLSQFTPSTLGMAAIPGENALEALGGSLTSRVEWSPALAYGAQSVARGLRWSKKDWRRAIIAREVLGPPRALQDLEPR